MGAFSSLVQRRHQHDTEVRNKARSVQRTIMVLNRLSNPRPPRTPVQAVEVPTKSLPRQRRLLSEAQRLSLRKWSSPESFPQ
jgi:hypothetical protein